MIINLQQLRQRLPVSNDHSFFVHLNLINSNKYIYFELAFSISTIIFVCFVWKLAFQLKNKRKKGDKLLSWFWVILIADEAVFVVVSSFNTEDWNIYSDYHSAEIGMWLVALNYFDWVFV